MSLKHGSAQLDSGVEVNHSVIDVFEKTALSTMIVAYIGGKTNFLCKGFTCGFANNNVMVFGISILHLSAMERSCQVEVRIQL